MTDDSFLCNNCGRVGNKTYNNTSCDADKCNETICEQCVDDLDKTLPWTECPDCGKVFSDKSNYGTCDKCGSTELENTNGKALCQKHLGVPTQDQLLEYLCAKAGFTELDNARTAYKREFKEPSAKTRKLIAAIRASADDKPRVKERIDTQAWVAEAADAPQVKVTGKRKRQDEAGGKAKRPRRGGSSAPP